MEIIKDLLCPSNANLKIRESRQEGVYVEGLTSEFVSSAQDISDLITLGERSRAVSRTNMNNRSSRSHTLLVLTIEQKTPEGGVKKGKLNLIDLAGSEKVGKTGAEGQTLEEAKKINQSLSALGNCIHALTEAKRDHIPFRDSKLTRLLQESLAGNTKTTLLVTCSPSLYNAEETISSLKFGLRAKTIKNVVKVNLQRSVAELQGMVDRLTKELVDHHDFEQALLKAYNYMKSELYDPKKGLPADITIPPPPHSSPLIANPTPSSSTNNTNRTPSPGDDDDSNSNLSHSSNLIPPIPYGIEFEVQIEKLKEMNEQALTKLREDLQEATVQYEESKVREEYLQEEVINIQSILTSSNNVSNFERSKMESDISRLTSELVRKDQNAAFLTSQIHTLQELRTQVIGYLNRSLKSRKAELINVENAELGMILKELRNEETRRLESSQKAKKTIEFQEIRIADLSSEVQELKKKNMELEALSKKKSPDPPTPTTTTTSTASSTISSSSSSNSTESPAHTPPSKAPTTGRHLRSSSGSLPFASKGIIPSSIPSIITRKRSPSIPVPPKETIKKAESLSTIPSPLARFKTDNLLPKTTPQKSPPTTRKRSSSIGTGTSPVATTHTIIHTPPPITTSNTNSNTSSPSESPTPSDSILPESELQRQNMAKLQAELEISKSVHTEVIATMSADMESMRERLVKAEASFHSLTQNLAAQNENNTRLEQEFKLIQKLNAGLSQELESLKPQNKILNQTTEELKERCAVLEGTVQQQKMLLQNRSARVIKVIRPDSLIVNNKDPTKVALQEKFEFGQFMLKKTGQLNKLYEADAQQVE